MALSHRWPSAALAVILVLGGALASGCDDDPSATPLWLLDPGEPMPRWLSAAGIYDDLSALTPATGFVPYAPPHVLFSNRASKARLLWLPPGASIDNRDPERWTFPVGAVLVKTFAYRHVEGRLGEVPIETRIIRHAADGWQYGVYHWGAAGGDALLSEPRWPEARFLLEDVNGSDFTYVIPGALDCEACHDTHTQAPVIGLGPGNLDPDLATERSDLFTEAPPVRRLPARTDAELRAMSYLVGNCVHCHHGQRISDNASFDLRPESLIETTVGVPTDSSASGHGIRVVPGQPEASALYEAVVGTQAPDYRGDFKPMPPVGIVTGDRDAAGILRAWIESLEAP